MENVVYIIVGFIVVVVIFAISCFIYNEIVDYNKNKK